MQKCKLNKYLLIDTNQDPPFFSLDSTFKLSVYYSFFIFYAPYLSIILLFLQL